MTSLRKLAAVLLLIVAWPAQALPTAASVPGGVALIRLGAVSAGSAAPRARFGEQRVLIAAENGQWFAVLGLALDLVPGSHELIVEQGASERAVAFAVNEKRYPEQHITLKDSSKVTLSDEDGTRALAEIATIQQLKRHWRDAEDTDSNFQLPAKGRLASRFGLRRYFNGELRAPHSGLDLAVGRGTPIGASAPGQVLAVGDYFFNGRTVFVDHGNGLISMYCHLERIDVAAGDAVARGQRLGLSGMSGRASGPHLHWSVILNGAMVDPELFVKR
ncbi:MAG: Peptidase [Proteobacteria bacterium]|nr:Peptidase [Pseudomonadota bacterium]